MDFRQNHVFQSTVLNDFGLHFCSSGAWDTFPSCTSGRPLDALARLLRVSGHEGFLPHASLVVLSGWSGWRNQWIFASLSDSLVGPVTNPTSNSNVIGEHMAKLTSVCPTIDTHENHETQGKRLDVLHHNQFYQYHIGLLVSNMCCFHGWSTWLILSDGHFTRAVLRRNWRIRRCRIWTIHLPGGGTANRGTGHGGGVE